jgi:hypothetical protein
MRGFPAKTRVRHKVFARPSTGTGNLLCRFIAAMEYECAMDEREPGFFSGLDGGDLMGIAIALLFSLSGFI